MLPRSCYLIVAVPLRSFSLFLEVVLLLHTCFLEVVSLIDSCRLPFRYRLDIFFSPPFFNPSPPTHNSRLSSFPPLLCPPPLPPLCISLAGVTLYGKKLSQGKWLCLIPVIGPIPPSLPPSLFPSLPPYLSFSLPLSVYLSLSLALLVFFFVLLCPFLCATYLYTCAYVW
jgi:hypothetical protein